MLGVKLFVDGEKIDLTTGFENLHTDLYKRILSGHGFGLGYAVETLKLIESL